MIRPSALGDVCRTVPVLAALKRSFPEATIDWLVQDSFVDAIKAHPDLGDVIPFPRHEFARWWRPPMWAAIRSWLGALKARRYDIVLDLQGLGRSGVFAWATGAPHRFGYADAREFGFLGVNHRVAAPASMHTVDRMLMLARAAGAEVPAMPDMRLYVPESDPSEDVKERFAIIAPTTRWPAKQWPAERFALVAQWLLSARPCGISKVLLVGAKSERIQIAPLLELAKSNPAVVDRVGATTVSGLMRLVRDAALVVANDSAALHMAVGFGRPLIGLFGPTRVERVGPYQHGVVLQHLEDGDPMDHKNPARVSMMMRISAQEVQDAIGTLLNV